MGDGDSLTFERCDKDGPSINPPPSVGPMRKLATSCYNGTLDGFRKETTMKGTKNFDRQTLEQALAELGCRALAAGQIVEIVVYGGSALLLTLNRQINTGDVDAVFEGNRHFVRKVAAEMAEEFGWDENWLNDRVKGWLSKRDSDPEVKALFKTYPSEDTPGLRVYTAKPEYLFAMKCRAMRIGGVETNSDIDDIRLLARTIGIRNSGDALTLVEKFY